MLNKSNLAVLFLFGVQLYDNAPVKFSLSKPIFCCFAKPTVIRVDGIMLLGMIFSVLKGMKILGMLSFKSKPYSETLKKLFFGFAKSFDDPILPRAANSSVSAPLKTFRIVSETLKPIPKSCMLEWVTSNVVPKLYFFLGVKYTFAINDCAVESLGSTSYCIEG